MRIGKNISSWLKKILRTRKILIVSEEAVDYYSIGRMTQLSIVIAVLGFISWASYSTGSFMAAESQIAAKDQEIANASQETLKVENDFHILREDLMRVQKEDGKTELSEYSKFVIDQYQNDGLAGAKNLAFNGESIASQPILVDRMSFLEQRVEQLKQEKLAFVDEVDGLVKGRIKSLEKVIKTTGLKRHILEHKQAAINKKSKRKTSKKADNKNNEATIESSASIKNNKGAGGQGGPYIPAESSELIKKKQSTLNNIDRLLLLDNIVSKLPLASPINSARLTSRFGRRG